MAGTSLGCDGLCPRLDRCQRSSRGPAGPGLVRSAVLHRSQRSRRGGNDFLVDGHFFGTLIVFELFWVLQNWINVMVSIIDASVLMPELFFFYQSLYVQVYILPTC